jgi:NADPH-dependent 2,4-dienoyl-CoA reductase/sulfur reductase-like enzyme
LLTLGETVVIIDDNLQAGGQYFRQLPRTYKAAPDAHLLRETGRAGQLADVLKDSRVRHLPATTAWAAPYPLTIAYAGAGETGRIEARAVIIATGAHDKPFPFPGWTLPGVISAGGCLNLAKGNGLVPGGKVVVAGNGPLVLVAAATLAAAGAEVTHVLESQLTTRLAARLALRALDAPSLVFKGLGYRWRIARAGARFMPGKMVAQAIGTDGLQVVEIAPVGLDGRPSGTGRKRLEASTLVIGYGLTPSAEFSRLLGCTMRYSRSLGGWVPARSENFMTSVPGVFAVGDGAGIGGVEVAIMEGALVADAVVTGHINGSRLTAYRKLDRFRTALSESYQTPLPLSAADPDTVICRCEELRLGDLKAAMEPGDKHLGRLKAATRLGMGRCQGRNCLASASALLGLDTAPASETLPRSRPPARPVRIRDLIKDQSIGPAKIPDEAVLSKD